jgi:hypothetical protein
MDTIELKDGLYQIFFWISSNVGVNDNNRITCYVPNIGYIIYYSLEFKVEYFKENDLM